MGELAARLSRFGGGHCRTGLAPTWVPPGADQRPARRAAQIGAPRSGWGPGLGRDDQADEQGCGMGVDTMLCHAEPRPGARPNIKRRTGKGLGVCDPGAVVRLGEW
jgi:hypothetical protein